MRGECLLQLLPYISRDEGWIEDPDQANAFSGNDPDGEAQHQNQGKEP